MKRSVRYLTLLATLLGGSLAHAADRPGFDAYFQAQPSLAASTRVLGAARVTPSRVHVTSRDAKRGTPTFLWAERGPLPKVQAQGLLAQKPEAAAVQALAEHAELLGMPRSAILGAKVREVHDRGGPIVVRLQQEIDGIEVFRGQASVLLDRAHRLVAASNNLHPAGVPGAKRVDRNFAIGAADAVASAFQDLYEVPLSGESVADIGAKGDYRLFDLLPTKIVDDSDYEMTRPARAKKVYFQLPDRLVPAYYLELRAKRIDMRSGDAYAYVIAADDARVLYRENLTHNAAFNYRVWAAQDGDKFPFDGPLADYAPHPTGMPDGSYPAFSAPNLVSMEGFNKNPQGMADPWLPANATTTQGNNVDAYADHYDPDGYTPGKDTRPTITAPNTFDRTYDTAAAPFPDTNQVQAAVTNLFYVTNWLHDYWYDSGFDEAAGNAQQSNLGRGGIEGDPLHAEGQDLATDPSVRDNANMQAGADGESPIMQMYLWSGKGTQLLSANPPNMSYDNGTAAFGPQNFDVSGTLVLTNPADGCTALQGNVTGKIVLIDRGTCQFKTKAVNAANAGAIGMVLADNVAAQVPPGMADGNPPGAVNIPSLSVTLADGNALKAALKNGAVTVHMVRQAAIELDGTIDNSIISHEWGHYLHHRLVNCGGKMCGAMSEGWADFVSLHRMVRPGDNVDGTYAIGQYATPGLSVDAGYFGIRRVAYSADMSKSCLTFKHIGDVDLPDTCPVADIGSPDNTEVHNAGEIWATMMFEATVALIKRSQQPGAPYDFDGAKRRMADYVVAGMKMTPTEPTYTEQRDAILAAAAAKDVEDMKLMAQAFAKRGLGSCAVSPPSSSQDNSGLVESFEAKPAMSNIQVTLDDSVQSCDDDGILDAQEKGKVTVTVSNTGVNDLTDAEVTVKATKAGVSFPNGTTAKLGAIAPFASGKVTFDVELDGSFAEIDSIPLDVTVTSASTCETQVERVSVPYINIDQKEQSANADSVEATSTAWATTGKDADKIWGREQPDNASPNHVWHGIDNASVSDTQLESPVLNVSANDAFVISFKHKYSFEIDPPGQGNNNYDGGVIEVSSDNGQTWQDISQYANPGYGGTITTLSNNPIGGRKAYTNKNAAYPDYDTVTLNVGNKLAGKSVKVRFRIGSDEAAGEDGWYLDDLSFQGIENKPFSTIVADGATCAGVPVANAGPDLVVNSGDVVVLDGSKSSDPDNDPLTYAWAEQSLPEVTLKDAATVKSTFTAPSVDADTTLTFKLTVSDGKGSSSDTVDVLVKPAPVTSGVGGGGQGGQGGQGEGGTGQGTGQGGSAGNGPVVDQSGDCGCSFVGSDSRSPVLPLAAAGLLALGGIRLRRRRRG